MDGTQELGRRGLLKALLAVLAAGPAARVAHAERARLEGTAEWRRLLAVWKEAEEIVANKRGPYPFDRAGKERVLAELGRARDDLDGLVKSGLLAEPAAELLKKDLAELVSGVQRFRTTEQRLTTCYRPMMAPNPRAQSLGRLRERLPLVERLAAAERLQPAAVERALLKIERDLGVLGDGKLPAADAKLRRALVQKVAALRARLRAAR